MVTNQNNVLGTPNMNNEITTVYSNDLWLEADQYNSENNSYQNVNVNLKDLYTTLDTKIDKMKRNVQIIPVDYNTIFTYVTSYSTSLVSYYMDNLNKNMSKLVVDTVKGVKNGGGSLVRDKSKKISELQGRDVITQHKDHSWFAIAQYDSRVNSYVNIAMNLNTITSYCTDYSDDKTSYTFNTITDNYHELIDLQDKGSDVAYVNNSQIGGNIISYSFSYNKNYLDWQFL